MDLRKKLDESYTGHLHPERSLFRLDPTTDSIVNEYKLISNDEAIQICQSPVPPESIQLIRFRARPPVLSSTYHPDMIRKDLDSLVTVLHTLHFPLSPLIAARQDRRLEVARHFDRHSKQREPVFYVCGSRICAIWVNDLDRRSTRMVMVNFMLHDVELKVGLHELLRELVMPAYQNCFTHPMFMILCLAQFVQISTVETYTKDAVTLHEIENDFVTLKSAARIETMQRLRDLARCASHDKHILIALQKIIGLVRRVDETYYTQRTRNGDGCDDSEYCEMTKSAIKWHVDQLEDILDLDIAFLTSIMESTTNQQVALSGIINLQDGTSMKTIAVITMTFLPSTFVASLFSMPMLQWDDTQGRIVTRQFWIYWAVVIPLTMTVVIVWLGWWYWRSTQRDSEHVDRYASTSWNQLKPWLGRSSTQGTTSSGINGGYSSGDGGAGGIGSVGAAGSLERWASNIITRRRTNPRSTLEDSQTVSYDREYYRVKPVSSHIITTTTSQDDSDTISKV